MAASGASSTALLILGLGLCLLQIHMPSAIANNLRRTRLLHSSHASDIPLSTADPPYRYFEVTKPIDTPRTKPCSYKVLTHQFANTYGKPPVVANYTPPSDNGCSSLEFSKIILEWTATSRGRQFDRIFGVWLNGVELLRSCTAEPRATDTIWTVRKDITRYHSLLMKNGGLAVYLGNIVDETYTGIYNVNITMHFYPDAEKSNDRSSKNPISGYGGSNADLILPVSRNLPLEDGLWFKVENASDIQSKSFSIPQNVYRAVLEVYVSFHENDEFWFGNYPNEYIEANNLTSVGGNGPFREVLVSIDGETVGGVWPFTVIFTGGVNPLFWRPITAIGSFDLPSYDLEITPFLSKILDGKVHEFGFSVTNALNVWYINANLHLWLDKKSKKTTSKLLSYTSTPLVHSSRLDINGLDGNFQIRESRSISAAGWVNSSYGKITTLWSQKFNFSNNMTIGDEMSTQIVYQVIRYNDRVDLETGSSSVKFIRSNKKFPFIYNSNSLDLGNGTFLEVSKVTMAINENKGKNAVFGVPKSKLRNVQRTKGYMVVKDNKVVSGFGTTGEVYEFDGNRHCYFRNVSSSNYTILYDDVESSCDASRHSHLGFGLKKHASVPFRVAFLESESKDGF